MHLDALSIVRDALADRYAVEGEVGRGGMAYVWRARDLRHDRDVAIKLLFPELARAVGGERFLREIRILARLSHPHILPLLDSGTVEIMPGLLVPWYVMPFVAEETLRGKLTREGPLPVPVALRYTRELCSALAHAHAQGYIHRDIKPENILLRGDQAVLADFGIARAVTVASGTELSSTGLVVGTPAYMSPEQSLGSDKLDPRSDIYSLGVVLYEMLAGHPPFTGHTPQALSARHQFDPPPPIGTVRPGLPAGLEAVVAKALAKVPADRYQGAEELDRALVQGLTARRPGPAKRIGLTWILAGLVLLLGLGGWGARNLLAGRKGEDPNRFVVLPFRVLNAAAAPVLNGDEAATLVTDALTRWTQFGVVSSLTVGGALASRHDELTPERAAALARGYGAGRILWGEIAVDGAQIRVTAVVYDSRDGREITSRTSRLVPEELDPGTLSAQFAALTYGLVLPGQPAPADAAEALGAKSLPAWRLYVSGDSALNTWNLPLAEQRYTAARTLDPEYPNANLKLAEVGNWLDRPPGDWRGYAQQAAAARDRLTRPHRLMAAGLIALADGQFPRACEQYRALLAQDSLDFRAWFGLGECGAKDEAVLPDSASPSGWRFRSSYAAAVRAYARALTLVPGTHLAYSGAALRRLATRMMVASDAVRGGVATDSTAARFAAYPGLDADTLAFVPYPIADLIAGEHIPATWGAALATNRRRFLAVTRQWLLQFPTSDVARIAHAEALELAGSVTGPDSTDDALTLTRQVRKSARAGDLSLAVREVRLLVKAQRVTEAFAVAESALAQPPRSDDEGMSLAALAVLVGRTDRAADLYAEHGTNVFGTSKGEFLQPPAPLARDANRLLVYSSVGAPTDSITSIAARLRTEVQRSVPPARRETTLEALQLQAALLAYPLLVPPVSSTTGTARTELAISRGDTATAREVLRRKRSLRPPGLEATLPPDFALLEARLWALAGDSAEARDRVDVILEHPAALGLDLLSSVTQTAALGRAVRFRLSLGEPLPRTAVGLLPLGRAREPLIP